MFCPKCSVESVDGQRFCKGCGTNLQLINDALKTGESSQGPFGIDVDALARNAKEFAESWKKGWSGATAKETHQESQRSDREMRRQAREEARLRNLPKPKEYMSYSWQHNLRNGLVSLFGGAGFGVFLYYFAQTAVDSGLVARLEEMSKGNVQGIEPLVRMIWMIALIPILKGLAQIIYASFFAESMATLKERFTPAALPEPSPAFRVDTAPVGEQQTAPRGYEPSFEHPPSVTEHTTQIFEEGTGRARRESQ